MIVKGLMIITHSIYVWSRVFYGAKTSTFQKFDQKRLGSFEMRCWRRMQKISWTGRVRNEEVKEERNILHTIKIRKAK
jgi:hypothetical protein